MPEDTEATARMRPRPVVPLLTAIASLPLTFARYVAWAANSVWNKPSSFGSLDQLLMAVGPLAFVLLEQMLARFRWESVGERPPLATYEWTTAHVLNAGLLAAFAVLCAYAARVWWHRYRVAPEPPPVRDQRVSTIMRAFIIGTLVGMAVRLYLGDVSVHDFAAGSSPIMAGLLFGVILVRSERISGSESAGVDQELQLGAVYVLLGAVATALGTIPASGWFFGTCFLVICGSLAAAAYLVLTIALR